MSQREFHAPSRLRMKAALPSVDKRPDIYFLWHHSYPLYSSYINGGGVLSSTTKWPRRDSIPHKDQKTVVHYFFNEAKKYIFLFKIPFQKYLFVKHYAPGDNKVQNYF